MSILIVDDSLDSRLLTKTYLSTEGHTGLWTAASAYEDFSCWGVDNRPGAGCTVDFLTHDFSMFNMDGVEACLRIISLNGVANIPIIMVTGDNDG